MKGMRLKRILCTAIGVIGLLIYSVYIGFYIYDYYNMVRHTQIGSTDTFYVMWNCIFYLLFIWEIIVMISGYYNGIINKYVKGSVSFLGCIGLSLFLVSISSFFNNDILIGCIVLACGLLSIGMAFSLRKFSYDINNKKLKVFFILFASILLLFLGIAIAISSSFFANNIISFYYILEYIGLFLLIVFQTVSALFLSSY